ncbi:cyclic pyranopterin phosphate synthase [Paraperlucidibaca baekdonensis]|uniref:GTP 3',8-cyclase n=1 Tax=Paraperlucidibaca baekdonensis TaxID=748120 RepID=A0A3E0H626_9GAMM|nr:GTP 3',8-cyclase MoaA [Paraperlucidibaca baekdonensis]REH38973.1 cyclic pyranopterin phosphate synthase [Paraperlucidibaca baekdonensis]
MSFLIDGLGRRMNYLRLSLTDRCDLRCRYCMADDMRFLPREQTLTRAEIRRVAGVMVAEGIGKIRLTGGEPLVRPDIISICEDLAALPGLNELVLSTNGRQLAAHACALKAAGVSRLNISLDSLKPERFHHITRHGVLAEVIDGIDAAVAQGFQRIRLNCVMMSGCNDDEIEDLLAFALARGIDICFIEEMPLGDVGRTRADTYLSSADIIARLNQRYTLLPMLNRDAQAGPARYLQAQGYPASRIGFISPHSNNFCASCNRLRLTAEGRLLLCLGHEHSLSLRDLMRAHPDDDQVLREALHTALAQKPARHEFAHDGEQLVRFMNVSGG